MDKMQPAPVLTPLCLVSADVAPLVDMGAAAISHRRMVPISGGRVVGPRLDGEILPGGADWQERGALGDLDIDARYVIKVSNGDLISVRSRGMRTAPVSVLARLERGEAVEPTEYYFRTIMRFDVLESSPFAWLNRVLAVARGRRLPGCVELSVYEIG